MRLSFIFELLLIILIIAFSAYARVIDRNEASHQRGIKVTKNTNKQGYSPIELPSLKQAEETMNKHCYCNENICNCCRDFHIPLVRLTGPGCASLQYLQGDNLQVQLSFGNNVLTTQTISGRNPKPICVALPGGYSKFCGKIYSIKKEADRHFKACLGLELQSSNELEASLRVSCFRFGPDGLKLRPAEEIPVEITSAAPAEDDDDDDIFGLDDDDDEEDDDDDDVSPEGNQASAGAEDDDDEEEDDDDDDDVLGFGALLDIFTGDDETTKKPKVTTPLPILQPLTIIPFLTTPSSLMQVLNHQIPEVQSETVAHSVIPLVQTEQTVTEKVAGSETVTESATEETATEAATVEAVTATESILPAENENKKPESSEQTELETVKPERATTAKPKKAAKPSQPTTPHSYVKVGNKKPAKPIQIPDPAINDVVPQEEQEEEDDEDDILDTEDLDEEDDDDDEKDETDNEEEDEDEEEQDSSESEESDDVKDEDLEEELDDDDDEEVEETEALGALIEDDDSSEKTKSKKTKLPVPNKANEAANQEEDDADYGYSLSELLARKTPRVYRGRESKVMRL